MTDTEHSTSTTSGSCKEESDLQALLKFCTTKNLFKEIKRI